MRKKLNVFEDSQHVMENQITTLEKQVVELTRIKHELLDANNVQKSELIGMISKEEASNLNQKIVELQEIISSLEGDNKKYKELYDTAMKQYSMLENQVYRHTKENESLKNSILELQSLNDSNQAIGRLHRDQLIAQLNETTAIKKYEQSQSDIVKLSVKENKLNKLLYEKIEQLVQTREEYRNKIREYQQKIVELSHNQKYLDQIESLMNTSQMLELAKINVEQQYQTLRQQDNDLQTKLMEIQIKLAETESILGATVVSKDTLEWRDKAIQLKVEHMKLSRENTILKEDVAHLEKTKGGLESALKKIETDLVNVQQDNEKKIGLLTEQIKHLEEQLLEKERDKDMALLLQRERVAISTQQESPLTISQRLEEALRKIEEDDKLIASLNLKVVQLTNQLEELQKGAMERDSLLLKKQMENQELMSQLSLLPNKQTTTEDTNIVHRNIHLDYQILDNLYKSSQDEIERLNLLLGKKETSIINYQNILNTYRQNFENEMEKANEEITRLNELLHKDSTIKINAMKKDLESSEKIQVPSTSEDLSISVKQMDHLLLEREVQIRELSLQLNNCKKDLLQTKDLIVNKQQEFDILVGNYQSQLEERDNQIQDLQKNKHELEHALTMIEGDLTSANENFKAQIQALQEKLEEDNTHQEEIEKLQLELKTLKSKKSNNNDIFSETGSAVDEPSTTTSKGLVASNASNNTVKRLKIQLASRDKQIKNFEDAITLLKQEVLDAFERGAQKGKDSSSEEIIQGLNGRIFTLETDLKSLSQTKIKLQKELEQCKANLDSVTVQQIAQQQKAEALTNKLNTDLKKAQKQIQNLKSKLEKLSSESETSKAQEAKKIQEIVDTYEKKIKILSEKLQTTEQTTPRGPKTLQRRQSTDNISLDTKTKEAANSMELQNIKQQLNEKSALLTAKESEVFALKTQLYDLQMKTESLQRVIEVDNKSEIQNLVANNKQLQERINVLDTLLAQHEFAAEDEPSKHSQNNLKKLQESLLRCQKEKSELEQSALKKEAMSMDLMFEKEHEAIKNATYKSRIKELEEELATIKGQLSGKELPTLPPNKESEYLLVIDDLKKMIERLKKDNTSLKKSSTTTPGGNTTKVTELTKENQELRKSLLGLETQLQNLPDNRSTYELSQDNRQLQETIMKQKKVVEEINLENASLQSQLNQLTTKNNTQQQKFSKEKAKMEGTIQCM